MTRVLNTAHFCSGWGTTFEHVSDMANGWELWKIRSRLMVASKPSIWAIQKARNWMVDIEVLKNPKDPNEIIDILKRHQIDHVFLNGYLPKYPTDAINYIITERGGNSYNQHPGPLRENWIDFWGDWKLGMYGSRVTAARVLQLISIWAEWDDIFTESTTQYVSPSIDKWKVIWVKKLDFKQAFEWFKQSWGDIMDEHLNEDILSEIDFSRIRTQKIVALNSFISDIQSRLLPLEHQNVAEIMKKLWNKQSLDISPEYSKILIPDENEHILIKAKQRAVQMYPRW